MSGTGSLPSGKGLVMSGKVVSSNTERGHVQSETKVVLDDGREGVGRSSHFFNPADKETDHESFVKAVKDAQSKPITK